MAEKPTSRGVRAVADLVSELLDPVLARKAGMTTGLIAAWTEIAGPRLGGVCRPEKLSWPARRHEDDPFEPATLVVACEGAAVLRLQHQSSELVARVNAFFGYPAVDRLKIVQKAVADRGPERKPRLRDLSTAEIAEIDRMTANIEDPKLRAALKAFGASVRMRTKSDESVRKA